MNGCNEEFSYSPKTQEALHLIILVLITSILV